MKQFSFKVMLFSLPILLFCVLPISILSTSREFFFDIDGVVADIAAQRQNYLIGYAYNEDAYKYLKYKTLISLPRQNIVVLGSSRVLQFRDAMFSGRFYNAGYTIRSIADLKTFIELVPQGSIPDLLLLGLDQWMFNAAWDNMKSSHDPDFYRNNITRQYRRGFKYLTFVYRDLLMGKMPLKPSYKNTSDIKTIGLNAAINNKGMRNDGSMFYGSQIDKLVAGDPTAFDYHFANTFGRIDKGTERFEYGDAVNPIAIKALEDFLNYCQKRNIKLVAFMAPLTNAAYEKMVRKSKYEYLNQLGEILDSLFAKYNCEYYHFTNFESCGSTDSEALDGFHGGEKVYLRILLRMSKESSALKRFSRPEQLNSDLKKPLNNYTVYAY